MNIGIKLLIGAAGAGLLYTFLKKKKAALENIGITKIDVYIDLPKTQAVFYSKIFYRIKIELFNSADVKIDIRSIEAKILLNGMQIGVLESNLKTIIPAKSRNSINVSASVNTGNAITSIIDIITEGKATIAINGSLGTDLGIIEFQKETIV